MPDEVNASHILFETTKRGDAAALALAQETRAKLLAGADFATVAREVSDDSSVRQNWRVAGLVRATKMDPVFSKAGFSGGVR